MNKSPFFRKRQNKNVVKLLKPIPLGITLLAISLSVNAETLSTSNLIDMSLEELANIEIISVSKKSERLADAAASVFVITGEDIRRSGATTLPEALRLAPNLQVARVDARNYAVTARGFNSPFENKLLVLIDGRSVYSPLFSGVFWDAQDVVLEDVARIEVISGPGATIWGANAVNGVINVITRSAIDTQGGLLSAGGSVDEKNGVLRYGGELGNGGHYRVYGKYAENDDTQNVKGVDAADGWHRKQAGFRSDWGSQGDAVTVQGDAYNASLHQFGTRDIYTGGANLLGRLNKKLADDSDIRFQIYLDQTKRDQPHAFNEHLNTIDMELQHSIQLAEVHNLIWGGGYRYSQDRVVNSTSFAFLPGSLDMHWGNVFAQDEIDLRKTLRLTLGWKFEHNNYTGMESLPNIRLAWSPATNQLIWGSASRAVRAPSRIDRDLYAPPAPIVIAGTPHYILAGGPDFASEVAKVVEVGYRVQPVPSVSYSVTVFHSSYDKLRTLEPGPGGLDSVFLNKAEGTTHGVEMWGSWQALRAWRLTAGFVDQKIQENLTPDSHDAAGLTGLANNDPKQYWMLRSSYDISEGMSLDMTVHHVGELPKPVVSAYTTLDLRFGWKVRPDLELSVVGQNLFNSTHVEFGADATGIPFDRSLFFKAVWHI